MNETKQLVPCRESHGSLRRLAAAVVAGVLACCALDARALTEVVDGITWTYTVKDSKATVGGGSKSSPAVPTTTSGVLSIPSALGGCPVTSIGKYAFYGCSGLQSVTIPEGVTSIGERAFDDCSGLTSVTIPEGVTSIGSSAFYECSGLTSVTIPEGVTSIGSYAFDGCSGLQSVTIPSSVTSIGEYAFSGCSKLASVTILEGVTSIGERAFYGCSGLTSVTIPSSVTSIGERAFYGCSGLTSVTIPSNVTKIGSYAFYDCSGLTSVTIPSSVTSIGEYAFSGCSKLASVTISEGVTNIGTYAFYGCSGLMSVTIPSSVTSIGTYAFSNCSGLTSVTISAGVTSIGSYAFDGCSGLTSVMIPSSVTSIGGYAFRNCSGLMSVTISEGVTSIGSYAFYGCRGLTSLTIPSSVTSIGSYAFRSCTGLTSVTISEGVTKIGNDAFYGCSKLTSVHVRDLAAWCEIDFSDYDSNPLFYAHHLYLGDDEVTALTIPEGVTSIGSYAFDGCSGLTSVTIPSSVTSIGTYAFSNCSGLTSVTISEGVTSIGERAFDGCSGLTSVTIPSSVTSIGTYVFYGCSKLASVTISEGVTSIGSSTFQRCAALHSVKIPESVTSIGSYAFDGCSGLTSVTIPSNVTSIGGYAFRSCSRLESVTIPSGVKTIDSLTFCNCSGLTSVTIPSSVTKIGSDAFYGCSKLTSVHISDLAAWCKIDFDDYDSNPLFCAHHLYLDKDEVTALTIPEGVTKIGSYAFYGCSGLTSVTIPSSVKSISSYAFSGCSKLASVTISEGMTSIGESAFSGCSGLMSVTIPSSVTSIGSYAFYGCRGLTSLTIPSSVTSIGSYAFRSCTGLTSVTISEGVTSIGESAFYDCSGLTSVHISDLVAWCKIVFDNYASNPLFYAHRLYLGDDEATALTIPEGVTKIGSYAFDGCSGLTALTIPEGVTKIGSYAFRGCSGLMSVTIPSSVTSIGSYAFRNCSGLTSVTISEGVTSIGERAFDDCSGLNEIVAIGVSPDLVEKVIRMFAKTRQLRVAVSASDFWELQDWIVENAYANVEFTAVGDLEGVVMHANEVIGQSAVWSNDCVHLVLGKCRVEDGGHLEIQSGAVVRLDPCAWLHAEVGGEVSADGALFVTCDDEQTDARGAYEIPERYKTMRPFISWENDEQVADNCRGILHGVTCGRLAESAVWKSDEVHVVGGTLTVPSGIVLTIEKGSVVKFLPKAKLEVQSGGACVACGVIFTHINDDSVGGDTLGDGDSATPEADQYSVSDAIEDDNDTEYRYQTVATSGTISKNALWFGHRVYRVTGNLTVASGVTLTICPGAIVKFASGLSLTVNGMLDAQGTRVEAIVFTSDKDDEWGGDTNGDGDATHAQAGDWHQITGSGTVKMNYCQLLWCSAQNNQGALYPQGGTWTFDNSCVAHCQYDCMRSYSGTFTANNSVFMDSSMGAAPSSGTSRFVNCLFYDLTTAVRWGCGSYYNCIFAEIAEDIIDTKFYSSTVNSPFEHCCFWAPNATGDKAAAKVGKDGNIWADPKFLDPDNGDFRIAADSPCVDAGEPEVAPELDYYGRPRMGLAPDIGIYETEGAGSVPLPNLAAVALAGPSTLTNGEKTAVSWTVANVGKADATASWVDEIRYVSSAGVATTLVRQPCSDLASGTSREIAASFIVPTLPEGRGWLQLAVNADGGVYEGAGSTNNVLTAEGAVDVVRPSMGVGSTDVTVPARGTVTYALGSGVKTLRIAAGTSCSASLELKGPFGAVRTVPARRLADGTLLLSVPADAAEGGTVVLSNGSSAAVTATVEADDVEIAVVSLSPTSVPAGKSSVLTVTGCGMDRLHGAELVGSGGLRLAVRTVSATPNALTVETPSAGLAAGTYRLVASDASDAGLELGTVTVVATARGPAFTARLEIPSATRLGRSYTGFVRYANKGDTDMPAPYLFVTAKNASMSQVGASEDGSEYQFVAIGASAPHGVLKAGDSAKVPFAFVSGDSPRFTLYWHYAGDGDAAEADRLDALASAATRLNARGRTVRDVATLEAFAERVAAGENVNAVCGTVVGGAGQTVSVLDPTGEVVAEAVTDADGHFEAEGVPPETNCRVRAGAGTSVAVAVVTTPEAGDLTGLVLAAPSQRKVSVVLKGLPDADKSPGTVRIFDYLTDGVLATTTVDETGVVDVTYDSSSECDTLRVEVELENGLASGTLACYVACAGVLPDPVEVDFASAALVSGVVRDGSGTPVPYALVRLRETDNGEPRARTADENGAYSFGMPAGGTFLIDVHDSRFEPMTPVERTLTSGARVTCDLSVARKTSGTIRGVVAGGAYATMIFIAADGRMADAVVGEDGTFEKANVPSGKYTLYAEDDSGHAMTEDATVTVTDGGTASVEMRVTDVFEVRGRVDAGGGTVETLMTFMPRRGLPYTLMTAADGTFSINLPRGAYTLEAEAIGCVSRSVRVAVDGQTEISLTLEKGGRIAAAAPAEDPDRPSVAHFVRDGKVVARALFDETSRRYVSEDLAPGDYTVLLGRPAAVATAVVRVAADGKMAETAPKVSDRTVTVRFSGPQKVLDMVEWLEVTVDDGSGVSFGQPCDASGAVTLRGLPDKPLALAVQGSGCCYGTGKIGIGESELNLLVSDIRTLSARIQAQAGSNVRLTVGGGASGASVSGRICGPFGKIDIPDVPEDYTKILVEDDRGLAWEVSRAAFEAAGGTLDTGTLAGDNRIDVSVRDADGRPVPDAVVTLKDNTSGETVAVRTTDEGGAATVKARPGEYEVQSDVNGQVTTFWTNTKSQPSQNVQFTYQGDSSGLSVKRTGDTPVGNPVTSDGAYDPSVGGYNVTETKKTGGWDGFVKGAGDFFKGLGDAFNSTVGFGGDWMLAANTIKECEAQAERCLNREYPKEDQCAYNVAVWNSWHAALEEYQMRLEIVREGFKNFKLDGLALGLMDVYKGAAHVPKCKESIVFGSVAGLTEGVCELTGLNKVVQKYVFKADVNVKADPVSVWFGLVSGSAGIANMYFAGLFNPLVTVQEYFGRAAEYAGKFQRAAKKATAYNKSEKAFAKALASSSDSEVVTAACEKIFEDFKVLDKSVDKVIKTTEQVGFGMESTKKAGFLGKSVGVIGNIADLGVLYYDGKAVGECGSLAARTGEILRNDLVSLKVAVMHLEAAYDCLYDSCQKKKKDPNETEDEDDSETPKSCDPNEIVGPAGVGEQRLVKPGDWMEYTVYFENVSNATAAAQEIRVTSQLSPCLDWSTFEMGEIAFDNQSELGLVGASDGWCQSMKNGTDFAVRSELTLDAKSGKVEWYLWVVDPRTGSFISDAYAGILPPNDPETHCGEGHLTYRIKVREDAPKGTRIDNSATIVFDYNDPIETDPSWWNTVAQMQGVKVMTEDGELTLDLIVGLPYGELPDPGVAPKGRIFGGWYTGPNGSGRLITTDSLVEAGDSRIYPYWVKSGTKLRPAAIAGIAVGSAAVVGVAGHFIGELVSEAIGKKKGNPTYKQFKAMKLVVPELDAKGITYKNKLIYHPAKGTVTGRVVLTIKKGDRTQKIRAKAKGTLKNGVITGTLDAKGLGTFDFTLEEVKD